MGHCKWAFDNTLLAVTAVQEERQRVKEKGEEVESTSGANNDMPVEQILEAELAVDPKIENYIDTQVHFGKANEELGNGQVFFPFFSFFFLFFLSFFLICCKIKSHWLKEFKAQL